MSHRLKMQDPREQYPAPPFPRQPQPAPGLARRLQPPADHGKKSYKGSGKLEGRKALVTGGDSGIGRAIAIAYAREGADVAISYLPVEQPDADEVIALIEEAGRKAVAFPGDLRDESYARDLPKRAADEIGGLDVLVVNAGHQQFFPSFEEITTEDFDATMRTNLYALFWTTRRRRRSCRSAHPSSPLPRFRPTTRPPRSCTMRRPRRVSLPSPRRLPRSSSGKASAPTLSRPAHSGRP